MNTIPLSISTSRSLKKRRARPSTSAGKTAESTSATRIMLLQNMVPIAVNLVSSQLDAFSSRLADEMHKLSDQSVRPEEATVGLEAHNLIKRNGSGFYRLVTGKINAALTKEVSVFNTKQKLRKEDATFDGTSQTYEQMESRVLLNHASQALEVLSAESLVMLNTLIGRVLHRMPIDITQNPFRPEIFVQAVYQAWMEFDPNYESHLLVLRLLQPTIFLQLTSIYEGVNHELMARGVRPDAEITNVDRQGVRAFMPSPDLFNRDPYLRDKLKRIFTGDFILSLTIASSIGEECEGVFLDSSIVKTSDDVEKKEDGTADKESVDRHFFEDLLTMQKLCFQRDIETLDSDVMPQSTLRTLFNSKSAGKLSIVERNTIELLARIFDFVVSDQTLRDDIKKMILQLQVPILRVALLDNDFFFRDAHPARTFMDILGSSGSILDAESEEVDPLLDMIVDVVERVQLEFDQQIDLFSDVVSDLENFLKEEEQKAQEAIIEPVQTALNEEKMRVARELAEHDVAIRVETGEVAGFLEVFLLDQWIRILTIAHSVKEEKPHALENALKTMDDLIWSLRPKNSAAERKELIAKLPAMLTLLNAWLNAIRWDEPDRVLFFSKLAERHASMARAPLELSPRRQLEIAVNIAQRASNRRLDRFVQGRATQAKDEASKQVETLECGMWLDFENEDEIDDEEQICRFKLAWISPKRTTFIFANRQGFDAFSISAEELLKKYREGLVTTILSNSLLERAMNFALRDLQI